MIFWGTIFVIFFTKEMGNFLGKKISLNYSTNFVDFFGDNHQMF
jgi:hypothetical protein